MKIVYVNSLRKLALDQWDDRGALGKGSYRICVTLEHDSEAIASERFSTRAEARRNIKVVKQVLAANRSVIFRLANGGIRLQVKLRKGSR
jgi:hypothetical protein